MLRLLAQNPPVVNYLRRVLLDPAAPRTLLRELTELSSQEVATLRDLGLASTHRGVAEQTVELMVRQVGRLFLQPLVDAIWDRLDGTGGRRPKPTLSATTRSER